MKKNEWERLDETENKMWMMLQCDFDREFFIQGNSGDGEFLI